MRKVLALLLLAGAAAPALAAGDPGDRHGGWRHDSTQQSSDSDNDRSDRSDRQRYVRSERSNERAEPQVEARVRPQAEFRGNAGQPAVHVDATARANRVDVERIREARVQARDSNDTVANWHGPRVVESDRRDRSDDRGSWRGRVIDNPNVGQDRAAPVLRQQDRPLPRVFRNRVPIVSNSPREGTQPPLRVENRHRSGGVNWSTRWRNDNRYDWQNWRRHHRSHFRLGIYYDPFGWGYRPYQIGWRLWPDYYRSSFWINDPWQYRLPYAPPGTRWVRYYNDAVLVDTWDGEVVDVIYNFFW